MNRDRIVIEILVVVLAVILLGVLLVADRRLRTANEIIESLTEQIAEIESQSTQTGGLETEPPEIELVDSEYRFPIASSDFLRLTSPFGLRVSPIVHVERYHEGVDIAAAWHAQVVSVADGVVVEHWPTPDGYYRGHPVFGGYVVIQHANGWTSSYAHLSWTRVHQGDHIRAGEVIGRVGHTGEADGDHLHFELHDATGEAVNPLLYVQEQP